MKLRNKKTGETGNLITICASTRVFVDGESEKVYNSLAELNEEWEDAPEEPKDFWFIGEDTRPHWENGTAPHVFVDRLKSIGNYFETKEEAEKTVEKLKAWKRLKDKGFKFRSLWRYLLTDGGVDIRLSKSEYWEDEQVQDDLDLLFGGGE